MTKSKLIKRLSRLTILAAVVLLVPSGLFAQSTTAVNDFAITGPNPDSVNIYVLANDTYGSGGWDFGKVKSTAGPTSGTLEYITDNTTVAGTYFKYTPNQDVISLVEDCLPIEADNFTYEACDTANSCASAQVSIVVAYEADLKMPKKLNVKKMGVIPVQIRIEGLDITAIDPNCLMLEGVPPIRSNMPAGKKLNLKFKAQDIVKDLRDVPDRTAVILQFTGANLDREAIFGEESVIILNKGDNGNHGKP